ncbi:MAG: hypothetical protein ACJ8AI_03850 [Rhodopila sp.]
MKGYRPPPGKCPCCSAKAILYAALHHYDQLLHTQGDDIVVDLGIIRILRELSGLTAVSAYGEIVMIARDDTDELDLIKPGRWVHTLAEIRRDMEGRFGKVLGTGQVH